MKKLGITLFVFIINLNWASGQEENSSFLLKKYRIKSVEGYVFKTADKSDSTLITVEEFNRHGNRTKIQIFDSSGLKATYEYLYLNDTIKVERKTYFKDKLSSITKIFNDEYGNELKCIDFDKNGKKTGFNTKSKYNDRRQLVEYKFYHHSKLLAHRKYEYYKNGNIKELTTLRPKSRAEKNFYDEKGKQLATSLSQRKKTEEHFENFNGALGKMTKITLSHDYDTKMLGIAGWLDLKQKDILYFTPIGFVQKFEIEA